MLQLFEPFAKHWASPFDFDFLDREFNRLFPAFQQTGRAAAHPVNLFLAEDGAKAVLDAPGWQPEWLQLLVESNKLHIEGRIPDGTDLGNLQLGDFHRVINLPFRVQEDQVSAELRQGRLVISLVKREEDKPKRIQVNVA